MGRKKTGAVMCWTLAICLLIMAVILFLAAVTTSTAYRYKHTIDPLPEKRIAQQQTGPKQPQ
ncbi:YtzI protein [Geobacillus sp. MMMUD3]|nr:YtzI protein [Geobacillus sp. MMMUD3]